MLRVSVVMAVSAMVMGVMAMAPMNPRMIGVAFTDAMVRVRVVTTIVGVNVMLR